MKLQLCPQCNTMKRFEGDMCGRCLTPSKSMGLKDELFGNPEQVDTKVEEIADPFYDEANPRPYENLVFNINKAIASAVKEERERIVGEVKKIIRDDKSYVEEGSVVQFLTAEALKDTIYEKLKTIE